MVIKKKGERNWEYCVYIGQDENGKKKYKRKCGFTTKKACVEEASTFENISSKKGNKTFKEVGLMYLDDCRNRGLRQTTLNLYETLFNIICSDFEKSKSAMNKITSTDILNFISEKTAICKSNYKRYLIFHLKSIFAFAEKNNFISKNIFDNIPMIPQKSTIKNIWNEADLKKYLPILKNFKYFDIVYLALETGLRRGELLALTWDCINFDRKTLCVTKSYVSSGDFIGFSDPKTKSGFREIALLEGSVNLLKKRYKNRTSKYVFPNPENSTIPIKPNTLSLSFCKFLNDNNLKHIRFHDLRHIHATLLLNKNVNYKMLSKRLGHTNVAFTLQTYTHILPDSEIKIFQNLSSLF